MSNPQDTPTTDPQDVAAEFEHLDYTVDDHFAVITIERPEALNALNHELLFELGVALELAESDMNVRALIVTGSGRAFVAGADVTQFQNLRDGFSGREAALSEIGRAHV